MSITKFCPNLKKFFIKFDDYEILQDIFNSCQYLEGIVTFCEQISSEKELFETVAKFSPKNFMNLMLHDPELIPNPFNPFL